MWNRTENQIKLVLIRHGETDANKEHRYLGRTDEPLCEQAKVLLSAKKNCYPNVGLLFTSPMKRCIETAEILYPDHKPILIDDFREMNFGAFEGKNYKELNGDLRYQAWIDSGGTIAFPDGESREAFIARCKRGMCKAIPYISHMTVQNNGAICRQQRKEPLDANNTGTCDQGSYTVGMVVHGGTIMALCSAFGTGDYFDYQVANGDGYVCKLQLSDEEIQFTGIEKLLQVFF